MSYSLYDSAVILARDALKSLSVILKKAETHANAASFPSARLAEDMLPLSFQVHSVTDTAQKIVARTSGTEPLSLSRDGFDSFDKFHARIAQVLEVVEKADKEVVNKRVGETVTLGLGPGKSAELASRDYVNGYGLPNLFFHLTTAYAILRKEGVPLGKQDFQGSFLNQYISK
ncbi:hypothetical protein FDECE_18461 [Fusarium decemcellulare]|nr:hypothetical protein FDECE_18461 [Fusarium decemcellulare]